MRVWNVKEYLMGLIKVFSLFISNYGQVDIFTD